MTMDANGLFAAAPAYAGGGMVPASNFGGGMGAGMFGGGLGGLLSGLFGDSGDPYKQAMDQYRQWGKKVEGVQNPFLNAGQGAIGDFQGWLKGMSDPSGFINGLMKNYQESPYAHYLQQQGQRAGINAASASGLIGSTPFLQQMQQNAENISSADMNQWLQNVLGINTQYGQGEQNLVNMGQNSANVLSNFYGNAAPFMGEQAYNKAAAGQNDMWNTIGGAASLAAMFL